jgi:hypothetical protein
MAANKTRARRASVARFIAALGDARRPDARTLLRLMRSVSREPARLWGPSIIGFGRYHYRTPAGREGEMPRIAFAPRGSACVVYLMRDFPGRGALLARLGPHPRGRGCLYLKRLADVDLRLLERLIRGVWRATGERRGAR